MLKQAPFGLRDGEARHSIMTTRIEEIRDRGMAAGLHRAELDPDPYREFERRFAQAIESGIAEPNAMCLSTVDAACHAWGSYSPRRGEETGMAL